MRHVPSVFDVTFNAYWCSNVSGDEECDGNRFKASSYPVNASHHITNTRENNQANEE
jgi:hypothetical protein